MMFHVWVLVALICSTSNGAVNFVTRAYYSQPGCNQTDFDYVISIPQGKCLTATNSAYQCVGPLTGYAANYTVWRTEWKQPFVYSGCYGEDKTTTVVNKDMSSDACIALNVSDKNYQNFANIPELKGMIADSSSMKVECSEEMFGSFAPALLADPTVIFIASSFTIGKNYNCPEDGDAPYVYMAISQKRGYIFNQNFNRLPYDKKIYYTVNKCGDASYPKNLVILKCTNKTVETCGAGYVVLNKNVCMYGFNYTCGALPTFKPLGNAPIGNLTQATSCYPNYCDSCNVPVSVFPSISANASVDFLVNYTVCGSQCFFTQTGTNCQQETCINYGPFSLSYNRGLSPSEVGLELPIYVNSTTQEACLYYTIYSSSSFTSSFGDTFTEDSKCTNYCSPAGGFNFGKRQIRSTHSSGSVQSYSSQTSVSVSLTYGPTNPNRPSPGSSGNSGSAGTSRTSTGTSGTGQTTRNGVAQTTSPSESSGISLHNGLNFGLFVFVLLWLWN